MSEIKGKSVYGGIAIGRAYIYKKDDTSVKRNHIDDTISEIERFEVAKSVAKDQLHSLYEKAVKEVGEVNAQIFEVHQLMLDDPGYVESITHIIESQNVNSEYAVAITSDNYSKMFSEMDDEYMKARAADIKDISNRLISVLKGEKEDSIEETEPVIIFADDLAPSETVGLDKNKVLAFVTRFGSYNSHTAILARTMNIPAIISADYKENINGKRVIVDGYEGIVFVEPDADTMEKYTKLQEKDALNQKLLQELKGKDDITKSGKSIKLYANIGTVSDVVSVLENDAAGIGLFRSEFLYIGKNDYPTEEEQFIAYKAVVENMAGKKVIIRTLDIGADKKVDYFNIDSEENPAMGYRAIRICLDRPEVFKTQLRAIYRASYYGNISIMYPMIISVDEVIKIKSIVEEVKNELKKSGIPFREVEQGIMIETPAAVMISDELAKEVDFFSIGTNDLTQYTLAIDRQNAYLDNIYDAHHKAILRMIKLVIDNGHKENCWVGICGELGSDTSLTEEFIKMGIDELSVTPSAILRIRKIIRDID